MFRFLKHLLLGSKISPDQVGPFTKKEFGLRPLGCINKILRHVRLWSMRPKVSAVRNRSFRCVNKERVRPRNAMIHMNWFQLDFSKADTIAGSERLEF